MLVLSANEKLRMDRRGGVYGRKRVECAEDIPRSKEGGIEGLDMDVECVAFGGLNLEKERQEGTRSVSG
jgi:hypothetical protein